MVATVNKPGSLPAGARPQQARGPTTLIAIGGGQAYAPAGVFRGWPLESSREIVCRRATGATHATGDSRGTRTEARDVCAEGYRDDGFCPRQARHPSARQESAPVPLVDA